MVMKRVTSVIAGMMGFMLMRGRRKLFGSGFFLVVLLLLSLSVAPAIATTTAPSARPTVVPTEHATYLSAAAAAGNTTIKPNQFYGPYAIDYNQQIHFNFSTSSCSTDENIHIYVEVLQGDVDIHVGSSSSASTGSDYLLVSCAGRTWIGGYVIGSYDTTSIPSVYSLTTEFEVYTIISTSEPDESPFNNVSVVHHLYVNGSEVNAYMLQGAYSFLTFTFDVDDGPAGLYIRTADIGDPNFSIQVIIDFENRLTRLFELTDSNLMINVDGGSAYSRSVDAYDHVFTFNNNTFAYCDDTQNCTVTMSLLNTGTRPVDVWVSIKSFMVYPDVVYGPYTRNRIGTDSYILNNDFCTSSSYAHIFVELLNGYVEVSVAGSAYTAISSQYIVLASTGACQGVGDLVIKVHVPNVLGVSAAIYKLEVLIRSSDAYIASPFDSSESIVTLSPNTVSDVVYATYSLIYVQWQYSTPALLLIVNTPTADLTDDHNSYEYVFACFGSGTINRPLAYSKTGSSGLCSDGSDVMTVTQILRNGGTYDMVWNVTRLQALQYCNDLTACTLTAAVIVYNNDDDGRTDSICTNCGLHFLLNTDGFADYGAISTSPIAEPTASPTSPTHKPTHKPTAAPTARPTHHPTVSPTAPTGSPTPTPTTYCPTTAPSFVPVPTAVPTPTRSPTPPPTTAPSACPTASSTANPSTAPTTTPTAVPTLVPTTTPTAIPTANPSTAPTMTPVAIPTAVPTMTPTASPTANPSTAPTTTPTVVPTAVPTTTPTAMPTTTPSTTVPTTTPTVVPAAMPTTKPTVQPTVNPTGCPAAVPTLVPTMNPSISPTIRPSSNSQQSPTSEPTEHATYLSSLSSISIVPNVFYGPYVVQDGEDVNFDVVSTPCAAGNMLYIYLEVLQGDADLYVGGQPSSRTGSDYLEVDCTTGSITGYVRGSWDQSWFSSVYSVASIFEIYTVITSTFPARSPFDILEVVNPLSVNGSTANVNILPGAYSFFRFTFDASDQSAGLYIKTADIVDEFFSMELVIAFQDRLPRMCDSSVAAGSSVSGGSGYSHSVDVYVHLFTFKNETVQFCADATNCTIAFGLLNVGVRPVDVEVAIRNFLIVPGVAYGPYTRNTYGINAYVLKNFCAGTKYAHVYVELVNGHADVTANGVAHSAFSSQYIVVDPVDCGSGQVDLAIYVAVANTFSDATTVYSLEVLMSTLPEAISSPFESSQNIITLVPGVVSDAVYTDYSLIYLRWEFTGPAILLVVNNGPNQDDAVVNYAMYSCLGVGAINRPTQYSIPNNLNSCSSGGAAVAVTEVDRYGGAYSLMWNITNVHVGNGCSSASTCTIYVAAIVFESNDDEHTICNDCGLRFLLTTQHLSDYASAISPNPIASPTARPTNPTKKPTHKPTATPTARPTHHPTLMPTTPSVVPTEVPTAAPTEDATYHANGTYISIIPGLFYGPYEIDYEDRIYFNITTTSCAASDYLYIYLEVLQGDADFATGSDYSDYAGSDYLVVDCFGHASVVVYVVGTYDGTAFASVYDVATLFKLYVINSDDVPGRSPFDTLAVVNHLLVNGSDADVYLQHGTYAFFSVILDAEDPSTQLYLKSGDMSKDKFALSVLITYENRLPRMYDATDSVVVVGGSLIEYAANTYMHVFTFTNETLQYCVDVSNCSISIAVLNTGVQPIDLSVAVRSSIVVPDVAYGPYSRLEIGTDNFVLSNFCSQSQFAHVFVELVNGAALVVTNSIKQLHLSSQYLIVDPDTCGDDQEDLVMSVHTRSSFGSQTTVYKLEVLMRVSNSSIASPFDDSESVVQLSPNVISDVFYPTNRFMYLKWEYTEPVLLLVTNQPTENDDDVPETFILSCIGSSINRPTTFSSQCTDGLPSVTTVLNLSDTTYGLMWNITDALATAYCGDIVTNCTLTATVIVFDTAYDDNPVPCAYCGLHFLLTTDHLSDFARALTVMPVAEPTASPTSPTRKPTHKPTSAPTERPSRRPVLYPTAEPTIAPTQHFSPSMFPTTEPTSAPTPMPTVVPTAIPTTSPTICPTADPTTEPSLAPADEPTVAPTSAPTVLPSAIPSSCPTTSPLAAPTPNPTEAPTTAPSASPSAAPTASPSAGPTLAPTFAPTEEPSNSPTDVPTVPPSAYPTANPSADPSSCPSSAPTAAPSTEPTAVPSLSPTAEPSRPPSVTPTTAPTVTPSAHPTANPTAYPTANPTAEPSAEPSASPSARPTVVPSAVPSVVPTVLPTVVPSANPSSVPSAAPSPCPTTSPSAVPSANPTSAPISSPSAEPTAIPSSEPSASPTTMPSQDPTTKPSRLPSAYPTAEPSATPTTDPSANPTAEPTSSPSTDPTAAPSSSPSSDPTSEPTSFPTVLPTANPTTLPSADPTTLPTVAPTTLPSSIPSVAPTASPTSCPTATPTASPSPNPSVNPSSFPTVLPTAVPTCSPSAVPSAGPSMAPTTAPTTLPSCNPSALPSAHPSCMPSASPTKIPTLVPSPIPSAMPSAAPTMPPSAEPTRLPTSQPTSIPSSRPSSKPSRHPSSRPSGQPTTQPSRRPSTQPSSQPSSRPSLRPTGQPTASPVSTTAAKTSRPTPKPTTSQPSSRPTSSPTESLASQWRNAYVNAVSEYNSLHASDIVSGLLLTYFDVTVSGTDVSTSSSSSVARNTNCIRWSQLLSSMTAKRTGLYPTALSLFTISSLTTTLAEAANVTCAVPAKVAIIVEALLAGFQLSSASVSIIAPNIFCAGYNWTVGYCGGSPYIKVARENAVWTALSPCKSSCDSAVSGGLIRATGIEYGVYFPAPAIESISVSATKASVLATVKLSSSGRVYCAASLAAAFTAPSSVQALMATSQSAFASGNNITGVNMTGLVAASEYRVLCVAVSIQGATTSLQEVIRNNATATTRCCRQVVVSISTANALVSTSVLNMLTTRVTALPTDSSTLALTLSLVSSAGSYSLISP
jgi:hypothetical protein